MMGGREGGRGGRGGRDNTYNDTPATVEMVTTHGLSTFLPLFLRALRGYSTKKMNTEMGLGSESRTNKPNSERQLCT